MASSPAEGPPGRLGGPQVSPGAWMWSPRERGSIGAARTNALFYGWFGVHFLAKRPKKAQKGYNVVNSGILGNIANYQALWWCLCI